MNITRTKCTTVSLSPNIPKVTVTHRQTNTLLNCSVLKVLCPDLITNKTKYLDIFSNDMSKVNDIIRHIEIAMRKREELEDCKYV